MPQVLITGAGRGIGLELARAYAAAGWQVLATARTPMAAGHGITWLQADVTDPASVARLPDAAGPALDLLICNAGVYLDRGQPLETGFAADLWARTFAVNVTGVFLTVQALLPALRAGRGKIAIVSSQMGSNARAKGGNYIYRASKSAALNLGRNLATDLAAEGMPVGIYHPGWVRTEMGGAGADIEPAQSAAGLMARFAALDLATTGVFEDWSGQPMPL